MTLISESGLYTLVMRSNKPEAWAKYREYEENLRANPTIKDSLIVGDNTEIVEVF